MSKSLVPAYSLALGLALSLTGCVAATRLEDPASYVGYAVISIPDPADRPLEVALWYPTRALPAKVDLGLSSQMLAQDAPVDGRGHALILVSHGNGGGFASHADTAFALASAGFVVAAPNHTGDNFRDESYVGTPRWLPDRARHLQVVANYMLHAWPDHERLDGRVGVFGFSAGAFTALVAVGGVPELARVAAHCRRTFEPACGLWRDYPTISPPSEAWAHDPRISAAVVAAPGLGFTFAPTGLAHLSAAVQVWSADEDVTVPYASNTALILSQLPHPPDHHSVARAGHLSFITPCKPGIAAPLCRDADGFDRATFHGDLNRAAIAFYRARLVVR